ncbi:uncharacterized protein Dsimw501_GD29176, isoform B [Drosophila simulans]|nr:uncharacterized protein Dsimw501_GD29176, isoform B [Drosophila simulans]
MRNANPLSLAEHPRRSRGVHPWMWMWAAYREITIFQCRRCTSSPQELELGSLWPHPLITS